MKLFFVGFTSLSKGFSLIRQPGLRRYAVVPVLVNICVFVLLGIWAFRYFGQWLEQLSPFQRWAEVAIVQWLIGVLQLLFAAMLLVLSVFTFTLVANFLAAPFNSLLAERVEQRLRGQALPENPQSLLAVLHAIPKTLWSEVRKVLYLVVWIIPIGILYLIPGLQMIAPIVMLLFGAWLLALEYLDYPMGNHGMGFSVVKKCVRRQRLLSLGFGSATTLLTAIPIVNLIAMPIAVASATALWVSHYEALNLPAARRTTG